MYKNLNGGNRMGLLSRGMSADEVAMAIKGAVNDATTQATLNAHIAECVKDKAEIKILLAKQETDRIAMHSQNQERFDRINRAIYLATGVAMSLSFLASTSGREVLMKVFGH